MLPREHGAYAQLLLPLAAGLAAARPTLASACLAAAACAAFVAHEPSLVLLGRRGTRMKREAAGAARRWLAVTLSVALGLGVAALALSPPARPWVALPATFAAGAALLVVLRRERTLPGELVACGALASAAMPAAVAGGVDPGTAVALSAVFWATFCLSTVEVRAIAGRPAPFATRFAVWSAALATVAGVAASRPLLGAATLPVIVLILGARVAGVGASKLRPLGWTLAAATLLMAAAAVAAVRA